MKNYFLFLVVLSGLFFCACTVDETVTSNTPNSKNSVQTGVFLDSAVEGLYYETTTQSGYTNSKGEFNYLPGEKVSFYLGEIFLGDSQARPVLTPISIAETPKANLYTPEVQYIAALLQTLDIDGDPNNGIKLVPEVINLLEPESINLKQPERDMFLDIVKMVKDRSGIELNEVYPEQAAAHLAETIGENYQLYTSFLPVIESTVSPFEPITSVTWDHQMNEEGILVKSVRYENNPYRISAELVYTEYLETGYPSKMEITKYELGEPYFTVSKDILYNEDREVVAFKNYNVQGELFSVSEFIEMNADGMVIESMTFDVSEQFLYRELFDRNENGNVELHSRYSSETSVEMEDLEIRYEFTHTESGELLMSKQLRPNMRNVKSD